MFYCHDWCIVFTRCFFHWQRAFHFISWASFCFESQCHFIPRKVLSVTSVSCVKCFIIQVVGPDTSSVNIEMWCMIYIHILFLCFIHLYILFIYIHIIYMNTSLFLHVCRTGRNPLIELRAYGILTNDWQPRWADPRLQVRWTNIVWEVSRLCGLKHVSMNVHP